MSKLSEKLKAVAAAIGAIEKQFGKGAVMRLGEGAEPQKVDVCLSGSVGVDIALGCRGYPRGGVVATHGRGACGESGRSLHAREQGEAAGVVPGVGAGAEA